MPPLERGPPKKKVVKGKKVLKKKKMKKKGPLPGADTLPLDKARPKKKDDDLEFEFAETRVATSGDAQDITGEKDPGEIVGMGKIGITEIEEPEEVPEPEPGPEPEPEDERSFAPPSEEGPIRERDEVKEGEPEEGVEYDGAVEKEEEEEEEEDELDDDAFLERIEKYRPEGEEIEEVRLDDKGKKVKVLRVPPSMLHPKPGTGPGPEDEEKEEEKGSPRTDTIGDLSLDRKGLDEELSEGKTIKRRPGLGIELDLDKEKVRRLSAPILPLEFSYSKRLFYRQFRRNLLIFILPCVMLYLMYYYDAVTALLELIITFMFIAVLVMLIVYGMTPFYTDHVVTRSSIILKQGVYFQRGIPLQDVKSIRRLEVRVGDLGIYYRKNRKLYIISHREDQVEVSLKRPLMYSSSRPADAVVLNLREPGTFVRTVRAAKAHLEAEGEAEDTEAAAEV